MKKLFYGSILTLGAILLAFIMFPLGALYTNLGALMSLKGRRIKVFLEDTYWSIALAIDLLGNVICKDLFNIFLIKKNGFKFGVPAMTISECLGINQHNGTLDAPGKWLAGVLDKIEENHCNKSIKEYNKQYLK